MNGRINNIETEPYKKFEKKSAKLGMAAGLGVGIISFFELPSAKGWQDYIEGQVMHGISTYYFDGIFLDQPVSYGQ